MDILCIQHVPFEGPAALADWAESRGHSLRSALASDLFAEGSPEPSADVVFLMGGPMSANDADLLPWLSAEMEFLRHRLDAGTKMVGVWGPRCWLGYWERRYRRTPQRKSDGFQ